eukprot:1176829-Prorocentrum_minimum.AAC.4
MDPSDAGSAGMFSRWTNHIQVLLATGADGCRGRGGSQCVFAAIAGNVGMGQGRRLPSRCVGLP